jgi:hypothetical protein
MNINLDKCDKFIRIHTIYDTCFSTKSLDFVIQDVFLVKNSI